jgi:hypothetical protein
MLCQPPFGRLPMSPGLGALWESAINNAAQQLTLTRHLPTERNRLVGLQSLAVRARYLLAHGHLLLPRVAVEGIAVDQHHGMTRAVVGL